MGVANLMMDYTPNYAYASSAAAQVSSAAWSLVGIPIIAVGLWGIESRSEPLLRLYLYYLIISCLIDTYYLAEVFILKDACADLDKSLEKAGQAFACGAARAFSVTGLVTLAAAMLYIVYAVWSFCQDLADGGSSTAIAALLKRAEGYKAPDEHRPWSSPAGPAIGYDSAACSIPPYLGRGYSIS